MRIIIEEHQYPAESVRDVLDGITTLRDIDGKVCVNYVGYYYNPTLRDCVFILPKVLLEDEKVFGHCLPEDIIDIENQKELSKTEYDFIYELSVWIYRAIVVFRDSNVDSSIVLQQNVQQMGHGRLRQCNTFLDILLALQKFNKENREFFFFILRNQHSGFNKINWTRTVGHSTAYLQGNAPVYIDIINKKRKINFDEELLVIFFSILNYIKVTYGFPVDISFGYELITGEKFKNYLKGFGKARLMQIKYKYFSDKVLYLWELCYAFFDQSKKINVETDNREYILVKNFNIVFEAIIDGLIGDKIPEKDTKLRQIKYQPDGKMVDHIYQYSELTNNDEDKKIYYIGDSKYYKKNIPIGTESVYKQFTYARNVIQWNIDLFNDESDERVGHVKLRDDVTEGYNIIPNFFISAHQNTLDKEDNIRLTGRGNKYFFSRQFENRLFDRDTFLIAHYDVNFLFVVALYGRNNQSEKCNWKKTVREMFRKEIQNMLKEKFLFYAITPHYDVNAEQYVRENFQFLLGKIFRPFEDVDGQQYYSLALRNPKAITADEDKNGLKARIERENEGVRQIVSQYFYMAECELGCNPSEIEELKKTALTPTYNVPKEFLTRYYFEAFMESTFLVGCYKNKAHYEWIFGRVGKRDNMYNIRIDKEREGSIPKYKAKKAPSFLFLYNINNPSVDDLMMFKVHNAADTPKDFMEKTGYPNPQGDYVSYVLESEEITFGKFDIAEFLKDYKNANSEYVDGAPIFIKGKELLRYRK